jgi:hypothetical protein
MREHLAVVELDGTYGKHWSGSMRESDVAAYIDTFTGEDEWLSDVDHAGDCWCGDVFGPIPGEVEDVEPDRDFEAEDYGWYWNEVEQGMYDDDPSPYAGDYSEM